MRLTLLELLEATGGGEIGGTQVGNTFATYHTDSREVVPGGLFFALRGGKTDGHRFIADALGRGAAGVGVAPPTEIPHRGVVELLPNTLDAPLSGSSFVRRRRDPLGVRGPGWHRASATQE